MATLAALRMLSRYCFPVADHVALPAASKLTNLPAGTRSSFKEFPS